MYAVYVQSLLWANYVLPRLYESKLEAKEVASRFNADRWSEEDYEKGLCSWDYVGYPCNPTTVHQLQFDDDGVPFLIVGGYKQIPRFLFNCCHIE